MLRLIVGLVMALSLAILTQAKAPEWVRLLTEHPRLGQTGSKDIMIYRQLHIDFGKADDKTAYHCRLAFLIGGEGKFADFYYQESYSQSNEFNLKGMWSITAEGQISELPKSVFKIGRAFEEYVLFSDALQGEWTVNNYPVGSVIALEFSTISDELEILGSFPLQLEWEIDTTRVDFNMPEKAAIKLLPDNVSDDRIHRHLGGFSSDHFPAWEAEDFDGGYLVSAPVVYWQYYASGDTSTAPETWSAIAIGLAQQWEESKGRFSAATIQNVADIINMVEKEYRYVAVEIGAGRFIPHPPIQVFTNKYGDCKDLSFLLTEMLQQNGIYAFPVLVSTPAEQPFMANFPYKYAFNHCIVTLVNDGDTLYYDPTTQGFEIGCLPWQLQGAPALCLKPGADLIYLPKDTISLQLRMHFDGTLAPNGSFDGDLNVILDRRRSNSEFRDLTGEKVRDFIRNLLRPEFTFDLYNWETSVDYRTLKVHLNLHNLATPRGSALYFSPYPFYSDIRDSVGVSKVRGYYFPQPVLQIVEIEIKLPETVTKPTDIAESCSLEVGHTSYSIAFQEGFLRGIWSKEFTRSHYPPEVKTELDSVLHTLKKHLKLRLKMMFNAG